ncbi:MAG TPA: hypothetical protein VMR74_12735 [Gammaproteobacteria bacterium]|nr:hypothetical protein [Gammaproteobacteria bacterium]
MIAAGLTGLGVLAFKEPVKYARFASRVLQPLSLAFLCILAGLLPYLTLSALSLTRDILAEDGVSTWLVNSAQQLRTFLAFFWVVVAIWGGLVLYMFLLWYLGNALHREDPEDADDAAEGPEGTT